MKILHYNVFKNVPVGVRNQLLDEAKAAARIGSQFKWDIAVSCMAEWDVSFRTPIRPGIKSGILSDNKFYRDAYSWLENIAPDYNCILLRYRTANPWQAVAIRRLSNLYTVHHAIEEDEATAGKGWQPFIEHWLEKLAGRYSLWSLDGIIALTPEILEYETGRAAPGTRSTVYPNGVFLPDTQTVPDKREGKLKLLFVGSLDVPWHGLELAIKGLLSADPDIEIHVVGPRPGAADIHPSQIVAHGELPREKLVDVAEICDAGLGTFALERKGMTQACTLKVREYLANGLPVVSGAIDSGLPEGFPYYLVVNDVTDWNRIVEDVLQWRETSRDEVRRASSGYIDKQEIMQQLLDWLE